MLDRAELRRPTAASGRSVGGRGPRRGDGLARRLLAFAEPRVPLSAAARKVIDIVGFVDAGDVDLLL